MSSVSHSTTTSTRSSIFFPGHDPESVGLRIHSFINRHWKLDIDTGALGRSLGPLDLEGINQADNFCSDLRFSHRRFSSTISFSVSTPSPLSAKIDPRHWETESPSVQVAKLQFMQSVPVRRLVYTSKSHATSNFSDTSSVRPGKKHWGVLDERMKTYSTLAELEWKANSHRPDIRTPTRPHTVHVHQGSISDLCSEDAADVYYFPTWTESPPTATSHKQQNLPGQPQSSTRSAATDLPTPTKSYTWTRQYSPGITRRVQPRVPPRSSSIKATRYTVHGGRADENGVFDTPSHTKNSARTTYYHLPLRSNPASITRGTSDDESQRDEFSSLEPQSSTVIPSSPAETLCNTEITFRSPKGRKTSRIDDMGGKSAPTTLLRRLWRKCVKTRH